jgi:hypothetical protein
MWSISNIAILIRASRGAVMGAMRGLQTPPPLFRTNFVILSRNWGGGGHNILFNFFIHDIKYTKSVVLILS